MCGITTLKLAGWLANKHTVQIILKIIVFHNILPQHWLTDGLPTPLPKSLTIYTVIEGFMSILVFMVSFVYFISKDVLKSQLAATVMTKTILPEDVKKPDSVGAKKDMTTSKLPSYTVMSCSQ